MITRFTVILAAVLLLTGSVFAQPVSEGAVAGLVLLANGNPAPGAMVTLAGVNGGMHHHDLLRIMTNPQGQFYFPHVRIGSLLDYGGAAHAGFRQRTD